MQDQVAGTIHPTVKIRQHDGCRIILPDDGRAAEPVTGGQVLAVINRCLMPVAIQPDPGFTGSIGLARFFLRYRQIRFRHSTGNDQPKIDNLDGGIRV